MSHADLEEEDVLYLDKVNGELHAFLPSRVSEAVSFLDAEGKRAADAGRKPSVLAHLAFAAGVFSWGSGDASGALARLERATAFEPSNPQAFLAMVNPLLDLQRGNDALTACARAEALVEEDDFWSFLEPQVHGHRGQALIALGRTDDALRVLDYIEEKIGGDPSTRWCDIILVSSLADAGVAPDRTASYLDLVTQRANAAGDDDLLQRLKRFKNRH